MLQLGSAFGQTRLFIDNNPPTVYNERREAGAGVCSNQVISRVTISVRDTGGDTRTGSLVIARRHNF